MKNLFLHCARRFNDNQISFGEMKGDRLTQAQCGGLVGDRGTGGLQQGLFAPLWQQYGPVTSSLIGELMIFTAFDVSPLPPFEQFCLLSVDSSSANEAGSTGFLNNQIIRFVEINMKQLTNLFLDRFLKNLTGLCVDDGGKYSGPDVEVSLH
jgi:hypothetical protein